MPGKVSNESSMAKQLPLEAFMVGEGTRYERTVQIWDQPHVISVYQKSKSVWIAVGDYMGQRFEVKGSSPTSAAKHWAEAARYRGNGYTNDR
jgi:hypothetical protein